MSHPFKVWITPDCLQKLNFYATEALPTEIGGFARIEEDDDGNIIVTDLYCAPQQATGGTFDITPEMDAAFMQHMMKTGQRDEIKMYKSIWHSHPVGMGPSMSGTDVEAIKRRAEDGECFSLIISASRTADSERMAMHYYGPLGSRQVMFSDMPVQIGWGAERISMAKKLVKTVTKMLGAKLDSSDVRQIENVMAKAMCEDLPPTFNDERVKLRAAIKAEVKEKVSKPSYGSKYGFQPPKVWSPPKAVKASENGSQGPQSKDDISYQDAADLMQQHQTCERLFAVGYDLIDPTNPNPNQYVTKEKAEKARKLYKKGIVELNKELRDRWGVGVGDLVIVDPANVQDQPELWDFALSGEPVEVDGFDIKNGVIWYEVGGQLLWPNEMSLHSKYEDIMNWELMEQSAKENEMEIAG